MVAELYSLEIRCNLVPRLRLGTQCPEAPPRRPTNDSQVQVFRGFTEAEPPGRVFPGGAWEQASSLHSKGCQIVHGQSQLAAVLVDRTIDLFN
jgi:hypothetical protein